MSMNAWPELPEIARRLVSEATSAARLLGHSIAGFAEMADGRLGACCEACFDWAYVAPRRLGVARSSGPALSLPCSPART
jgi:hypothetical protein